MSTHAQLPHSSFLFDQFRDTMKILYCS